MGPPDLRRGERRGNVGRRGWRTFQAPFDGDAALYLRATE